MSAATDIRTIETKIGSVEYDADMPIGALRNLLGAGQSGDIGQLIESMAGFVTGWALESDPTDPSSWDALRRSEFESITTAVLEDLASLGEG